MLEIVKFLQNSKLIGLCFLIPVIIVAFIIYKAIKESKKENGE